LDAQSPPPPESPPILTAPPLRTANGRRKNPIIIIALSVIVIVLLASFSFLYLGVSNQNNILSSQIASDKSKITSLQSQISSDENQLAALQSEHLTDQTTISSLNSQIASDESQITTLNMQISNLESLLSLSVTTVEAYKMTVSATPGHPATVASFNAQYSGYVLIDFSTTSGDLNVTNTPSNSNLLPFSDFPIPAGSFYIPILPGTVDITFYTTSVSATGTVNATYVS
jgi:cell division protein FtsL